MSGRRLEPPGGDAPPASAWLEDGGELELLPLATEICRRYRHEFPDDRRRYGEAGNAWCVHDNQYLLCWAVEAVNGYVDMNREVAWLARVLKARDFPLERLARNLDIGAEVVAEHVRAATCVQLAEALTGAAAYIRSSDSLA